MNSWQIPALLLVAAQVAFASVLGEMAGYSFTPDFLRQLSIAAVFIVPVIAVNFIFFFCRCIVRQVESPIAQLAEDYRNNSARIFSTCFALLLIVLQVGLLGFTKSMIPLVTSFWADPYLAVADRVFLGGDLWVYAHWIDFPMIDRIYAIWAPLMFGTVLLLPFFKRSETRSIALLSWFLVFAIDIVLLQYALPSGGPIFYERLGHGSDFAGLPLHPVASNASDYLWNAYVNRSSELGGGISAFPSMHVATAVWMALTWYSYSKPLGAIGFVFCGFILFGSVYLGWHYLWDGIASIALALVAIPISRFAMRFRLLRQPSPA